MARLVLVTAPDTAALATAPVSGEFFAMTRVNTRLLALAAGAMLAASAPAAAVQQTLSFDDVAGTSPPVFFFTNYGGFNWGPRWAVVNAEGECGPSGCGFRDGRTSGSHVATNGFDGTNIITSATPFRLVSIALGSAWWNNLRISFVGKLGGSTQWTQSVLVNATASSLTTFPTPMIDTLEVTADLGVATTQVYTIGSGPRMVWDDFTFDTSPVTAVPEPAAWALLLAGFGLVGAMTRRQRVVAA